MNLAEVKSGNRIFQKILLLIFFLFLSVLVTVLFYANTGKSGAIGLTMSKILEIRSPEINESDGARFKE